MAECSRCGLQWVFDGEEVCPKCKLFMSYQSPIKVAGFEVVVEQLILYGTKTGLHDKKVRKGLDRLSLGERCGCGYLSWRICPTCYTLKK